MLISMQGNWKVTVKLKSAAWNQRFVVTGAVTGNGIYNGIAGTTADVTGTQWTISIQHDPHTGWRASNTRIKFPTVIGGNYSFDIESDDSGGDLDFNDLVLTCTTPVTSNDYIVYGHVKDYYGNCAYNPCWRDWIVIDSSEVFTKALANPHIYAAIKELYPERIPLKVNPNPPDPGPFKTMMIPVLGNYAMPLKTAGLYKRLPAVESKNKETSDAVESTKFLKNITAQPIPASTLAKYTYDKISLGTIIDTHLLFCYTEDVVTQTLAFKEYDRSVAELAGGPYTGDGTKTDIGNATTDMNGNYIFRYTQSVAELLQEYDYDFAAGENPLVQIRPDVIVSIPDILGNTVYESGVYFNVPNLKRIDLCMPKSVIKPARLCNTDNLITGIGLIPVPGIQNTGFTSVVRDDAYTHYAIDGQITNHGGVVNAPKIECGCWDDVIDIWGCMRNPDALYYTVRYKGTTNNWSFISDDFHCIRYSDSDPNSTNTKVGPFFTSALHVPGFGTGNVAHYKNIQREYDLGVDWWSPYYQILMSVKTKLHTDMLGAVDFRIDAYDVNGDQITSDLVTLYIDNTPVDYLVKDANFTTTVDSDCVLFALTDAEISQPIPLNVLFKANHTNGFLQSYSLGMGKGKYNTSFIVSDNPAGTASRSYTGTYLSCVPFVGSAEVLGQDINGYSHIQLTPTNPNSKWLNDDQSFCTFTVDLSVQKRGTNGYGNDGGEGPKQFIFAIQRVNP